MGKISDLINTTQTARLLAELTGQRWDRAKVHLYYKRGTKDFPQPDEFISGTPYWYRKTIDKYAKAK